jgi:hypothetical protein
VALLADCQYFALRESADGLSINNQTNLAIKGIIAIKAMSLMGTVVGKPTRYSVRLFSPSPVLCPLTPLV